MGIQQADNTSPEGAGLQPATVRKGRIVRSRGGEMPVLVGGIESRAVSEALGQRTSLRMTIRTYLAMMMAAGGFPMTSETEGQ